MFGLGLHAVLYFGVDQESSLECSVDKSMVFRITIVTLSLRWPIRLSGEDLWVDFKRVTPSLIWMSKSLQNAERVCYSVIDLTEFYAY